MNRLRYRFAISMVFSLGVAACAADEVHDDLDHADQGVVATSGQFVTLVIPLGAGCIDKVEIPEFDVVTVKATDDGSKYTYTETGVDITCDHNGSKYECASAVNNEFAPLLVSSTSSIEWKSAARFEGTVDSVADCAKGDPACDIFAKGVKGGFPCTEQLLTVGAKAMAEEFAPATADYRITLGEQLLNTCTKPLPVETTMTGKVKSDGKTLSIDGLAPVSLDCDATPHGRALCVGSHQEAPLGNAFLVTMTRIAWTANTTFEGIYRRDIMCTEPAGCPEMAAQFGEAQCSTWFRMTGTATTAP